MRELYGVKLKQETKAETKAGQTEMTLKQMHHVLPYAHLFAVEGDARQDTYCSNSYSFGG